MAELKKILYAEDEADIRTIAQMALEMMGGFTIKLCEDGQYAVEEVEEFAPDLILLDVMMPRMTGPQALEKIREIPSLKDVPVIFMTAKVQSSEIEKYKALGAVDVISKPFDPMGLPDIVNDIWKSVN